MPGLLLEDVSIRWLDPLQAEVTILISNPARLSRASVVDRIDDITFVNTISDVIGVSSSVDVVRFSTIVVSARPPGGPSTPPLGSPAVPVSPLLPEPISQTVEALRTAQSNISDGRLSPTVIAFIVVLILLFYVVAVGIRKRMRSQSRSSDESKRPTTLSSASATGGLVPDSSNLSPPAQRMLLSDHRRHGSGAPVQEARARAYYTPEVPLKRKISFKGRSIMKDPPVLPAPATPIDEDEGWPELGRASPTLPSASWPELVRDEVTAEEDAANETAEAIPENTSGAGKTIVEKEMVEHKAPDMAASQLRTLLFGFSEDVITKLEENDVRSLSDAKLLKESDCKDLGFSLGVRNRLLQTLAEAPIHSNHVASNGPAVPSAPITSHEGFLLELEMDKETPIVGFDPKMNGVHIKAQTPSPSIEERINALQRRTRTAHNTDWELKTPGSPFTVEGRHSPAEQPPVKPYRFPSTSASFSHKNPAGRAAQELQPKRPHSPCGAVMGAGVSCPDHGATDSTARSHAKSPDSYNATSGPAERSSPGRLIMKWGSLTPLGGVSECAAITPVASRAGPALSPGTASCSGADGSSPGRLIMKWGGANVPTTADGSTAFDCATPLETIRPSAIFAPGVAYGSCVEGSQAMRLNINWGVVPGIPPRSAQVAPLSSDCAAGPTASRSSAIPRASPAVNPASVGSQPIVQKSAKRRPAKVEM